MKHKFERYCKDYENIENFEKAKDDDFKGWCCHHRLETWTSDGERRLVDITVDELIALDMYFDRPAEELIFMKESEHHILHHKGKRLSEEAKKKISKASKGNQYHKGKKHTKEAKKKIGEKSKGNQYHKGKKHTKETKKKMSEAAKGRNIGKHWYNNGTINKFCYECPEGFVQGRLNKK